MMRRTVPILTALLTGQVVLAAVLHLGTDRAPAASTGPIVAFERGEIDAAHVSTGGATLELARAGEDGWRLPGADGFPADPGRVDRLLSQLDGMDSAMPIARSQSARERFRVAGENYERRIELVAGGETVATVFLGESAGAGRVYARGKGDDAIHEVEFALWQTPVKTSKWLDRSVPAVKQHQIEKAQLPDFRLQRGDGKKGQWQLVDGGAPKDTSESKATQLLGRLTSPEVEGVAKAEPPEGEPALTYTLTTKKGETVQYSYYRAENQTAHLYRSGQPWRYEVPQAHLAKLAETAPKTLLAEKSSGKTAQATAPAQRGAS